jgi:transglutaminase-like putative cysteine protease
MPRLRGRDAVAAAVAVAVAGTVALGLSARVASDEPWVDYRQWSWTLNNDGTLLFDWRHSYGPLDWPRKGTTLLLVKSSEPHYWKAEALDRFDGRAWTTSPPQQAVANISNAAASANRKWFSNSRVTVRGLRSDQIVAPGTILDVTDAPGEALTMGNATYLLDGQLRNGDSYTVRSYAPDPTTRQMRAAPPPDQFFTRYTVIGLPRAGGFEAAPVTMPLRNRPWTAEPSAVPNLENSRYGRVYRLAQRIAAGATTDYDIVRRVGAYLEDNYSYSEEPPRRAYPLEAFLFRDRNGYCQHFSGAAALMLRMLGIPTRVASGFAPGTLDSETKEYVVRDLDAHSWIEVWFSNIGWVPFDPTPASSPASSQATSFALSEFAAASAARGNARDRLSNARREPAAPESGGGGLALADEGGTPWGWVVAGGLAALMALAALVVLIRGRRRAPLPAPCGDADVDGLVRLLARVGLQVQPGTTLYELEQRLGRLAGPDAAAYASRLRRRRFGGDSEPCPGRAERRRLRRLLAQGVGAGPLTRLRLALPHGPMPRPGGPKLRGLQGPR